VSGRLIYNFNVSLDGFAAAADGDLDWGSVDEELHSWFNERQAAVQASLYGRKLYELMAAYWPTAGSEPSAPAVEREFARIWNATPKVVFSTTLERVEHNSRLVRGDVTEVLKELRTEFDGDLDVGGPTLAGQFIERGLVDEYRLVIHPVILGGGLPFWPVLAEPIRLRLVETHRFGNGAELRTYVPD
jgi:dihydrofolate reductase